MKRVIAILFLLPVVTFAADTNVLPKLVPAYGELPTTFWEQHQTAIIVSGFALLAVIVLSLLVLLRPKAPVVLSPEANARQALAKWQSRPEDGKLLSEVSQILRHYITAVFGLSSAEMTTVEFSAALAASARIGPEFAQMISGFLQVCDKEKFSPKAVAPPLNAVSRAFELIEIAEKRRMRPEDLQK